MTRRWTQIIEQAGDENIGAALVRLAQAAARVHMFQAARSAQGQGRVGGTDDATAPLGLRPIDAPEGGR